MSSRASSPLGLGFMGFAVIVTTVVLYRWKIQPALKKNKARRNEGYANYVFEREKNTTSCRDGVNENDIE